MPGTVSLRFRPVSAKPAALTAAPVLASGDNHPAWSMVMSVWDLVHGVKPVAVQPNRRHCPKGGTHAPPDDQGLCSTRTTHTLTV